LKLRISRQFNSQNHLTRCSTIFEKMTKRNYQFCRVLNVPSRLEMK
jgi:hypothetical protein